MKSIFISTLFVILILSLLGCAEEVKDEVLNSNNPASEDEVLESEDNSEKIDKEIDTSDKEIDTVLDYYPFVKNRLMQYKGEGSEYAEMEIFIEYLQEYVVQVKTINAGTTVVNVLEYKDGILREVFSEGEFYHIENMLDTSRNMDNIILKEPIEIGNSWEDSEGNKVEITSLDKDLDTLSGKYKALEVTTSYDNNASKKDYYVKEIGYIGNIYKDGEFEVNAMLQSIDYEGMQVPINVYYPLADEEGSKYINENIIFKTNDDIRIILEKLLKKPDTDKLISAIPENSNINKISLNRDNWNLEIDLSKGFIEDMNAGSSYEMEIINSIVNTLGDFYDVERVYITVGGELYSSGHLQLLEDEYFEVHAEGIEEFKLED